MAGLGGVGAGSPLAGLSRLELLDGGAAKVDTDAEQAKGAQFASVLKDKLSSLNAQQVDAGMAAEDMATGRVDDVAQTMLRIEQANVSLQMATQVRNKVVEAYQEVMRMQM